MFGILGDDARQAIALEDEARQIFDRWDSRGIRTWSCNESRDLTPPCFILILVSEGRVCACSLFLSALRGMNREIPHRTVSDESPPVQHVLGSRGWRVEAPIDLVDHSSKGLGWICRLDNEFIARGVIMRNQS